MTRYYWQDDRLIRIEGDAPADGLINMIQRLYYEDYQLVRRETYDGEAASPSMVDVYIYDERGLLIRQEYLLKDNVLEEVSTFSYDRNRRVVDIYTEHRGLPPTRVTYTNQCE